MTPAAVRMSSCQLWSPHESADLIDELNRLMRIAHRAAVVQLSGAQSSWVIHWRERGFHDSAFKHSNGQPIMSSVLRHHRLCPMSFAVGRLNTVGNGSRIRSAVVAGRCWRDN